MRAEEVRDCLALRWPDSEYLSIAEAPQRADRGGRKIDLLVVSLWQSRGLQRDAVEIKVSYSDWTRERKEHAKADFWWRHSNRFWIAAPSALAAKIAPELPPGWGLLSCDAGEAPKVARKADVREAESLTWAVTVGLLRAAADCGLGALQRAEARGREQGRKAGMAEMERRTSDGELKRLRRQVEAFEAASGVSINDRWHGMDRLGAIVKLVEAERLEPGWLRDSVVRAAEHAAAAADRLRKGAEDAQRLALLLAREIDSEKSEAA